MNYKRLQKQEETLGQSPELGGCPNSGRPFYSICNWTVCVQQKQIPESGMWFCLPHLHAYLKGVTFRSPLVFSISLVMGVANRDSLKKWLSGKVAKFINIFDFRAAERSLV